MLKLGNDVISLSLVPDFGARVTSLLDRRSGREWLVQGALSGTAAEDAVFDAAAARGWDECFPTVAVADGAPFGWSRHLRDHGDLWARPAEFNSGPDEIVTGFSADTYRFERVLTLDGPNVIAAYRLANTGGARFGFLYSQHMLIAARVGETLGARGLGSLLTDGGELAGTLDNRRDVTPVSDISAGTAVKLYGQTDGPCEIRCGGSGGSLSMAFDSPFLPALGIWACYGGWTDANPQHQLALEPTTAPADGLSEKSVSWLHPGQTVDWRIRITLGAPGADGG